MTCTSNSGQVHTAHPRFPVDASGGRFLTPDMQRRFRSRFPWIAMLVVPAILAGCSQPGGPAKARQELIVTQETALMGTVVSVNLTARFAVLNFPLGRMPPVDHRLNVYRNGLKVGEMKVCGPQRDDNTIADIIEGEARRGDEVRDR